MAGIKDTIKGLLFFKEPKKTEKFILKETKEERELLYKDEKDNENKAAHRKRKNHDFLLKKDENKEKAEENSKKDEEKKEKKEADISKSLKENLERTKEVYTIPDNGDMVLREFNVIIKDKSVPAFMIFFDGMVDRKVIDDDILMSMMHLANLSKEKDIPDVSEFIRKNLINHNQLKETKTFQDVVDEVNFGGCGIFVEGIDSAFSADVKGWEHRTVSRPNTELVIRGPQEGFNEIIRINSALVRKILKDDKLIVEDISIGKRSKTPCSMLYIKDIANEDLVNEVRRRLKSIKVDYLTDAGELEQLIEDSTFMANPQVMATERPDRVATMLTEGKVAVMLNGNPFVLVMPVTLPELVKSPEDSYVRFPYSILLKCVRMLGIFSSLLLPGLYVAITNFHQEMIPTDLLVAIASSREKVPFPSVVEILIMEVAFELIREAGIRIPGPIGPTLGIIGALILGQAAVAANIVSPILIIVVAVTGIGSFANPNFSLGFSLRILRFGYILMGAVAGFLGITLGTFIHGLFMVNSKSFGTPMMVPFAPKTSDGVMSYLVRSPIWKQEKRPDYSNPKKVIKQDKVSRGWVKEDQGEDGNDGNED